MEHGVDMSTNEDLLRLARLGEVTLLRERGARLLEPLPQYPYYLWVAAIDFETLEALERSLAETREVHFWWD
jgi:hypothetical protein